MKVEIALDIKSKPKLCTHLCIEDNKFESSTFLKRCRKVIVEFGRSCIVIVGMNPLI